jgi:hypothetical protein
VTEEIREEIRKSLESKENQNTIYMKLWDTAKVMLWGKFIGISAYIKKKETPQVNNLIMYLEFLENKNKQNPKPADEDK